MFKKIDSDVDVKYILSTITKLAALYGCVKIAKIIYDYTRNCLIVNKIPGEPCLPIIGNTYELTTFLTPEYWKNYLKLSKKYSYSPVFRTWLTFKPFIVFHKPESLEVVINTSQHTDKPIAYDLLKPWLGSGILTGSGATWYYHRKLLTPAFHFDILKDFINVINEHAEILIERLKPLCDQEMNLSPIFKITVLSILCESVMGKCLSTESEECSDYIKQVQRLCNLVVRRIQMPLLYPDTLFRLSKINREQNECLKKLRDFTSKILHEREADCIEKTFTGRLAFLDTLLKERANNPEKISLKEILEEVDTFMFAGHDTTSTALKFICYSIGLYPEIQKKVQKEVDEVFGSGNQSLTIEKLEHGFPYMDCVIKESLRLFPPTPVIERLTTQEIVVGGYTIPNRSDITIPIYLLHRDERYFPEPETFKPERFLPENADKLHSFVYIPFSAGRRNCVGQKFAQLQLKILLATILRHFNIECKQTVEELGIYSDLTLKTKKDILYKFTKRF